MLPACGNDNSFFAIWYILDIHMVYSDLVEQGFKNMHEIAMISYSCKSLTIHFYVFPGPVMIISHYHWRISPVLLCMWLSFHLYAWAHVCDTFLGAWCMHAYLIRFMKLGAYLITCIPEVWQHAYIHGECTHYWGCCSFNFCSTSAPLEWLKIYHHH